MPARLSLPIFLLLAVISGYSGAVYAGPPDYASERAAMVERLRREGITDQYVLAAMRRVPRHLFVAPGDRERAYEETSIPVGAGQALPPPRVVAQVIQVLAPRPGEKVLQVGAGCGYCTAVLCEITSNVYAVDLRADVLRLAKPRVQSLGYATVKWRHQKGCAGWPEQGPYDAILVLCAADKVPEALVKQLKDGSSPTGSESSHAPRPAASRLRPRSSPESKSRGGRLVIPIGRGPEQTITCLTKNRGRLRSEVVAPVRTEPMACQRPLP